MSILTRRRIIGACGAGLALTACGKSYSAFPASPASAALGGVKPAGETPVDIRAWMNEWMDRTKAVKGALHLARFRDPMYVVLEPIEWFPNPGAKSGLPKVVVPKGFVTDLASIPQPFWSLLRPDGVYTFPAIVHDYLYWTRTVERDVADEVLRLGMYDLKVGKITTESIYTAVRLGGQGPWDNNAKLRASGECRVISKLPDDAVTDWFEWKKQKDICAAI